MYNLDYCQASLAYLLQGPQQGRGGRVRGAWRLPQPPPARAGVGLHRGRNGRRQGVQVGSSQCQLSEESWRQMHYNGIISGKRFWNKSSTLFYLRLILLGRLNTRHKIIWLRYHVKNLQHTILPRNIYPKMKNICLKNSKRENICASFCLDGRRARLWTPQPRCWWSSRRRRTRRRSTQPSGPGWRGPASSSRRTPGQPGIGENLQKKRYHIYIKILVPDVCLVCRLCRYVCRCCPGEQCGCQQLGLYLNIVTFSTRWGNTGNRGNTQNWLDLTYCNVK